jgi:hypothetical protein
MPGLLKEPEDQYQFHPDKSKGKWYNSVALHHGLPPVEVDD